MIKYSNDESFRNKIQSICTQSLDYFVSNVPLQKSNFPILQLTYTLWRNHAYSRITKLCRQLAANNETKMLQMLKESREIFFTQSEKKYLRKFASRIQTQMNIYCSGLQSIAEELKVTGNPIKKEDDSYQIILQLGKAVWLQQLYLELLQDLLNLPYLSVFPQDRSLVSKRGYATNIIFQRSKESGLNKMINKTGRNIFNKIITGTASAIFSRAVLLNITSLFGTFNPVALGATFGISQYLEYVNKKDQQAKVELQLKTAMELALEKANKIKQIYCKVLDGIQKIVKEEDSQKIELEKQKVQALFLNIFEYSPLKVEETKQEDGWTLVNLEEVEIYQDIDEINH